MIHRRVRIIVGTLAAAIPGLAIADPVSIIAIGAQALAAGGVIATATAAWIGVGAAAYGMVQARKAQRKAKAAAREAQAAALQDRNIRAATNTPPRVTIYGAALTSGYPVDVFATDVAAIMRDGSARTLPDGYQHVVVVWSARQCAAITGLVFEGDRVDASDIGPDGWVLPGTRFHDARQDQREIVLSPGTHSLPVKADSVVSAVRSVSAGRDGGGDQSVSYTLAADGMSITIHGSATARVTYLTTVNFPFLRVSHHLGAPDQAADSYLMSIKPDRYTSAHRLRGLCYSVITYDLRYERWQSGLPTPVADILGALVYDPRSATYAASVNPALHVLDYLTHEDGFGAELADIDMPSVIAAANACDAQIASPVSAGTAALYRASGVVDTSAARESVLDDLCRSMAGSAIYSGMWRITAGIYSAPIADLTDDDLAGSISIAQAGAPDDQLVNGMRGIYIPRGALSAVDMEPLQNTALLAADGGRERWSSIDLPFTDENWRARNISRVTMETARNGLVINYPGKIHLLRLQPGDRVRVTAMEGAYILFNAKIFRVTDSVLTPRGVVQLTLQEDGAAAWDQQDTSAADPTPNTSLPDPWSLPRISGLAADSGNAQLIVQADGTIVPRIRLSWASLAGTLAESVVIKWARASGGEITTMQAPADQVGAYITGVADRQIINIEAYALSRYARGASAHLSHAVVGKTAPPTVPTALAVTEGASGERIYSVTHVQDLDHAGYIVRASGTLTHAWDQMTQVAAWTGPSTQHRSGSPGDGQWRFAVVAVDTSGNRSAPVYVTATLTQQAIGWSELLGVPGNLAGLTGSEQIRNDQLASSANMLFDSDFTAGPESWSPSGALPIVAFGRNLNATWTLNAGVGPSTGTIHMSQDGPSGGSYSEITSEPIAVQPGDRICASAYTGAHRCVVDVFAYFYGENGVTGSTWGAATMRNSAETNGGQALSAYKRCFSIGVAPAGTRTCRLVLRKYDTNAGQTSSYLFACRAQVEEVGANATGPGPWTPGPAAVRFGDNVYGQAGTVDIKRGAATDVFTAANVYYNAFNVTSYDSNGQLIQILGRPYFDYKSAPLIFDFEFDVPCGYTMIMRLSGQYEHQTYNPQTPSPGVESSGTLHLKFTRYDTPVSSTTWDEAASDVVYGSHNARAGAYSITRVLPNIAGKDGVMGSMYVRAFTTCVEGNEITLKDLVMTIEVIKV